MWTRIGIGIFLAALFIAVLYLGSVAQVVSFALCAILAVYEMQRALQNKGYRLFIAPVYVFAAGNAAWIFLLPDLPWYLLFFATICVIIIERLCNTKRTTAACFAAIVICVYPLCFFALLMQLGVAFGYELGVTTLLATFACPLIGDTFAYFIGSFFGKHKLCPEISPKKTVEGSIASVVGSTLAGLLLYHLQYVWGGSAPMLLLLILGAVCGVVGQVGDLFASLIKRWAQIKDFGSIFPGHGGILDRVDSVLMCAPFVYAGFLIWSVYR